MLKNDQSIIFSRKWLRAILCLVVAFLSFTVLMFPSSSLLSVANAGEEPSISEEITGVNSEGERGGIFNQNYYTITIPSNYTYSEFAVNQAEAVKLILSNMPDFSTNGPSCSFVIHTNVKYLWLVGKTTTIKCNFVVEVNRSTPLNVVLEQVNIEADVGRPGFAGVYNVDLDIHLVSASSCIKGGAKTDSNQILCQAITVRNITIKGYNDTNILALFGGAGANGSDGQNGASGTSTTNGNNGVSGSCGLAGSSAVLSSSLHISQCQILLKGGDGGNGGNGGNGGHGYNQPKAAIGQNGRHGTHGGHGGMAGEGGVGGMALVTGSFSSSGNNVSLSIVGSKGGKAGVPGRGGNGGKGGDCGVFRTPGDGGDGGDGGYRAHGGERGGISTVAIEPGNGLTVSINQGTNGADSPVSAGGVGGAGGRAGSKRGANGTNGQASVFPS